MLQAWQRDCWNKWGCHQGIRLRKHQACPRKCSSQSIEMPWKHWWVQKAWHAIQGSCSGSGRLFSIHHLRLSVRDDKHVKDQVGCRCRWSTWSWGGQKWVEGGNDLSWIFCLSHGNWHRDGVHQSFSWQKVPELCGENVRAWWIHYGDYCQ